MAFLSWNAYKYLMAQTVQCKLKCVAAIRHPTPKKEDDVTWFTFENLTPMPDKPKAGESFFHGQLWLWTDQHYKYKVGSEYTLTAEIG